MKSTSVRGETVKWSHNYPHVTGWWFVGQKRRGRFHHNIIEVREHRRKMQWSFLDGLTWNDCNNYPDYWWAGPIVAPNYKLIMTPRPT